MRMIAGLALGCVFLCVAGAALTAEPFKPKSYYMCDGDLTDFSGRGPDGGFRKVKLTDQALEVRPTDVQLHGNPIFSGAYAINPSETSPIQIFFTGSRNRFGSLRDDGRLYMTRRGTGTQALYGIDLKCRAAAGARGADEPFNPLFPDR